MSNRVALIAISAGVAVVGAVSAAAGTAVLAVSGTDSEMSSGSYALSTTATAIVSDEGDIDTGGDWFGDPRLEFTVTGSSEPVFVGVGPADEVERYLDGAAVQKVTDVDLRPFELTTEERAGSAQVGPPAEESFWVASSREPGASDVANSASTSWKIREGTYRVVVMNADGSTGVSADARFTVAVPHLATAATLALGIGIALLGVAGLLAVAGARSRDAVAPVAVREPETVSTGA